MLRTALYAGVAASCLATSSARAQVEVDFHLPAFFRATTQPVYYEGRASYWYGNRWYYRDGDSWRTYHDEPDYLRNHREHHEPERHYYERDHGRGFGRR